jgi:hypothetical protein
MTLYSPTSSDATRCDQKALFFRFSVAHELIEIRLAVPFCIHILLAGWQAGIPAVRN